MLFTQTNPNVLLAASSIASSVILLIVIVFLVIKILYLLTLFQALEKCSPHNRTMQPRRVWLNLVPCFSLFWGFVTVFKISGSLKNEFESRGLHRQNETYGRTLGLIWLLINLIGSYFSLVEYSMSKPALVQDQGETTESYDNDIIVTLVSGLLTIVDTVLWIMYWVKIAGFSRELDTIQIDTN